MECYKIFIAALEVLEHMAVHIRGALVKFSYGILEKDYSINRSSGTNDQSSLADTKAAERLISVDFIKAYYPS